MGYELSISDHELAEDFDVREVLWSIHGWWVDSTFWHAFFNIGKDMCGDDEPCTHVEVDCKPFGKLANILDCIVGKFAANEKMRQLAFDWQTYRRLVGLVENGHSELYLDGIGDERFGLMRSCFYVDSDNEYVNDLCDAMCGYCFNYDYHGVEQVINLIDILTSHDTIHVYRSY